MAYLSLRNHRKLLRLARILDIPKPHAVGYLHWLWDTVYESRAVKASGILYDWTVEDVEACAEWGGDHGKFAQALIDAGFMHLDDGAYKLHDYADWVPEFVKRRWIRDDLCPDEIRKRPDKSEKRRTKSENDGQETKRNETKRKDLPVEKPRAGGNEQTRLWDLLYETAYNNGPYPWSKRDAINLAQVHRAVGGTEADLERVIRRYLECADQFFQGHPIGKLLSQLPKFTAKTEFEQSWEKAE
jgi:hypothetical protein